VLDLYAYPSLAFQSESILSPIISLSSSPMHRSFSSSLAFDETWSTTPLPSLLPITTSISPNSSIIALLGSYPSDPAISFVPHPMLNYPTTTPAPGESIPSPIADEALSPTSPTSERARHLAVLFALAIHSGTDLSDIIRLTLEGSSLAKKQDDLLGSSSFSSFSSPFSIPALSALDPLMIPRICSVHYLRSPRDLGRLLSPRTESPRRFLLNDFVYFRLTVCCCSL
jgi:hypothetical protein